jgi:hypothetical protein
LEIPFQDLPKEAQDQLKRAFVQAIAKVVEESNIRSFLNNISDPIERRLLDDDVDTYKDNTGKDVLYTIYLLKPGEWQAPGKFSELKDKHGKVVVRYTCVSGDVCEPVALVTIIRVEHGEPVVTEKLLSFNEETGWKPRPRPTNELKER